MKTLKNAVASLAAVLAAVFFVAPAFAQEPRQSGRSGGCGSREDPEMMAKMMELAKLNENHKTLAELDGHLELHREDVDERRPDDQTR